MKSLLDKTEFTVLSATYNLQSLPNSSKTMKRAGTEEPGRVCCP